MAGAAKKRANQERPHHAGAQGSSSGETSSSGKATNSARSDGRSNRTTGSRRTGMDGNRDPDSPGAESGAPERDPARSRPVIDERSMKESLGTAGFAIIRGQDVSRPFAARPPSSKVGTALKCGLNTFDADINSTAKVYQFDVLVGNGVEKRGLIKKVWRSKAVEQALGRGFIFDDNKLAWSLKKVERELRITVDLDQEGGRTVRPGGKENKHRIVIRQTNHVYLDVLDAYMAGKCDFDNKCLEALTFLNHVIREYPALQYTQIKQSYFARGQERFTLGGAIEAFKGVYQSMRVVHGGPTMKGRLSLNIDVANGTFWTESMLHNAAKELTSKRDVYDLIIAVKNEKSPARDQLKKLRKLHVVANHRGGARDEYVIERLIYTSARDHKFEKDGKMVSIYDYFAKAFNVRLQHPDLPLCKMTKSKNTVLPMEVLKIEQNQRYNFKMDERQTSNMIKFAVEPPPKRWEAIKHGLKMLDFANNPVLANFGVKVNTNMKMVDGRLIPAPKVQFANGEAKPGTSGRWDLKGKKFLTPNTAPLKSWAVCVVPGRRGGKPDKAAVQNFVTELVKIYGLHGGRIENKQPSMAMAQGDDVGSWVTASWNAAGNQSNARPQLLVFVLPDKDSTTYGRIKRSAECRYGVVSQCMQYAHVQKAQGQYISNVCMKINAKLGGQTGRAVGPKSSGPGGQFTAPTAVIGADVSHGAPGAQTPSMAALTLSMDRLGVRYAAACETNGFRVEMITTDNINSMLKPMLQTWVSQVGGGKFPSRIIYFRDGVSEGQYLHVIQQEVHDMKALIKSADPSLNVPFIVVVGGKRHHVRFFPEKNKGDRNENPLPGTLIETGVTNPFENDFYLNSHAAIKGTARPMHYHVLLNEVGMSNEELQTLIYEQCYGYIRATTPISQHPAIYYAHIASNRAVPHDPKWGGSSDGAPSVASRPRSGSQSGSQGARSGTRPGSSSGAPVEFDKLLPMPNQGGINTSMWYV
ncbi:Protein argonaute [Vermiconidia calcicola]|uniref:Protein argonaute n=1 Tax=Vermiconidia calcicola TaxID=1690605 RepID=A0ACC3NPU5_9PEZI|nr:Protein argonaute [Vermiconidia calcicola]